MSFNFKNNKLLVVGGTSGMGFETAKKVLENGGHVIITGSSKEKTEIAVQELKTLGTVEGYTVNLMKQNEVSLFLEWIDKSHDDINLLVNAAGVFLPKPF